MPDALDLSVTPDTNGRTRPSLDAYGPIIGDEALERLHRKAERFYGFAVQHINATKHGGGVAEILRSLLPLLESVHVRTAWTTLTAPAAFYEVTKKIHNLLQGQDGDLTDGEWSTYFDVVAANAAMVDLKHDAIVVHDPQPAALALGRTDHRRWLWRCHIDLSATNRRVWERLAPAVAAYDDTVWSLPDYRQPEVARARFVFPAIDPLTRKNLRPSEAVQAAALARHGIPTDRPIVTQISRFDPWKDPKGVIEACRIARREVDFTLVMLGNMADDDPEGLRVFEDLQRFADERTLILPAGDDVDLVNTLQSSATVVLQKSIREGFGLTVTEAMWKERCVVAGEVGGIRHQITDGTDGFLVATVEQAAARLVQCLANPELAARLGRAAKETVRRRFLITGLLEAELDGLTAH
jgi:trehalose synthase